MVGTADAVEAMTVILLRVEGLGPEAAVGMITAGRKGKGMILGIGLSPEIRVEIEVEIGAEIEIEAGKMIGARAAAGLMTVGEEELRLIRLGNEDACEDNNFINNNNPL